MDRAERTFSTRCSFVAKPIDIWTGKAPGASSIRVSIAESAAKPIRTSDGSYAFMDVEGAECTLIIASSVYSEIRQSVALARDANPPVVTVALLPNSAYAPPPGASGFIAEVRDEAGRPLAGARLSAYADDEAAVRGRLAEETGSAGEPRIRVSSGNGKLRPGDGFVLRERDGGTLEWGFVADLDDDPSVLKLDRPFANKWGRGARLLPAVRTASDGKGVAVIPFRGLLPAACPVRVRIECGELTYEGNWEATCGSVVRLLPIKLNAKNPSKAKK
ncbi:carboxypeptidase-like regulatory domain-containing protein [Cohnella suwonensis]|uniref:Carboxypeptidase-like regulatory domain-containing protein n=1 Tax=Cohnella suwonensis TaxID=696072 RepID=A0ABW0LVD2_9BACL